MQLRTILIDCLAFIAIGLSCALAIGDDQVELAGWSSCGPCQNCPGGVCPIQQQQAAQPLPARCRINVYEGGGYLSKGSGTLVLNDRLVITCAHLFRDSQTGIECGFPNGRKFRGTLVAVDWEQDLAAVCLPPTGIQPLQVDASVPTGEVIAGGFGPRGAGFWTARGRIARWANLPGARYPFAFMTGTVRDGDSGGGVVNTNRVLVGVVWGCDGQTAFNCGPSIAAFLARLGTNPCGQPTQPTQPNQAAKPPAAVLPVYVPPVEPTSPAAAAQACNCSATIQQLQLEVAALKQQISAQQNVEQLAAAVAAKLPPLHFRVQDSRGAAYAPSEYQSAPLGSYVTLPFGPAQ